MFNSPRPGSTNATDLHTLHSLLAVPDHASTDHTLQSTGSTSELTSEAARTLVHLRGQATSPRPTSLTTTEADLDHLQQSLGL